MSETRCPDGTTRREVLTKAVFVAPAILTLTAVASFASAGSTSHDPHDRDKHDDKHEKKHGKPEKKRGKHDKDDD